MSVNRARRVAEEIKRESSRIIAEEIKDPRIASLTSVTSVELSGDLRHATVYVSIYGSEAEKMETMQTLLRATGFIRSEISKRIRLRYVPEIHFAEDRSLDYGAHIDNILKSLHKEKHGK